MMYAIQMLFTLGLTLRVIECRVFCQDAHASPWIPLGYSCPVMCQNIMNAIEKLKIMDYKKLLEGDSNKRNTINGNYINKGINTLSEDSLEFSTDNEDVESEVERKRYYYKNNAKLLRDQQNENKENQHLSYKYEPDLTNVQQYNIIRDKIPQKQNGDFRLNDVNNYQVQYEKLSPATPYNAMNIDNYTGRKQKHYKKNKHEVAIAKMAGNEDFKMALLSAIGNGTCARSKHRFVLIGKMVRRCSGWDRRSGYGDDLLRTLTRTMNRFSKTSFEFTEDMVELMLERVFGKGEKISSDLIDVGRLIHYLRNSLELHKLHRRKDSTIVLKPRHCLTLSMPGCFCRPGFVEKSGQCVQPADCFSEPSYLVYLARIIVH